MHKIIGIDPGDTTGVVVVSPGSPQDGDVIVLSRKSYKTADDLDLWAFVKWLYETCHSHDDLFVIVENYRITNIGANFGKRPVAVEVIGAIKATLALTPQRFRPLRLYEPARKAYWPDKRLCKVGYDLSGWTRHEKDAFRLVLTWLEREGRHVWNHLES